MAYDSRHFHTGTVKRKGTSTYDDAGGITYAETTVVTGITFQLRNVTPFDRESLATRFGLEPHAVMLVGSIVYTALIQNLDVLVDDSTAERWRILSYEPIYGRTSTPHHAVIVLQKED